MSLLARHNALVQEFDKILDWESKYKKLIELGKSLPVFPEPFRTEEYKVRGCQSQVWLHARMENGRVIFTADSDALLVRGLIHLVLRAYSEATPEEILQTPPDFIRAIGLAENLTPSRTNGLAAVIKQIKYYAMAFAATKR